MRMPLVAYLMAACLAQALPTTAQDSPQWRGGPQRTGAVTGPPLLATWPEAGPPLRWRSALPIGDSPGGVSVADGVAYVNVVRSEPGDAGTGGMARLFSVVYALDALTGEVLWQHDLGETARGWLGGAGTPAVGEGRVYALYGPVVAQEGRPVQRTKTVRVCCLDATDGRLIWEAEQEASTTNITMHGGPYGSPLLVEGVCLVQETGIVAYEAATGRVLWRQACADGAHAAPAVWKSGERTLILVVSSYPVGETLRAHPDLIVVRAEETPTDEGGVYALDLESGEPQWVVPFPSTMWNASTPVVYGDTLLRVGRSEVTAVGLDLRSPSVLWKASNPAWGASGYYGPSLAVADGFAYLPVPAGLVSLDLTQAGAAVLQELDQPISPAAGLFSSPVVAGERVIYGVEHQRGTGTLYLLSPGQDLQVLSRLAVPGYVAHTTPTVAQGLMYVRVAEGVACYDLRAAPPA